MSVESPGRDTDAAFETFGLEDLSPETLAAMDDGELADLAARIRRFLVASIARTGGHLGSNLGVVELTLALHRVFSSPRDRIASSPSARLRK